jgi:phosphatidate phosphatase APP1
MSPRNGTFWEIAKESQLRWDAFKLRLKQYLDRFDPLTLRTYRSHGGNGRLRVVGRLIEDKGTTDPTADSGVLANVVDTVRRFESDEIPDARIIARFGDRDLAEGTTDHEGFFDLTIETETHLEPGWHDVEVEVLESIADGKGLKADARVMVPPPDAEFAIISDVDDTVLESRATDLLTEIRLVFAHNASQRAPMPGAAPLYRMLEGGPDGDGWNPFFYVSRSGWGLYDLIEAFLDENDLPVGPLYLQDIAILEPKSPNVGSEYPKRDTIRRLFDDYPGLRFVLIGDSGQEDPELYRDLVEERPDRVRAVLIRAVTPPERDSEVREIIQEIVDLGVPAAAAESSVSLARAAADFGLIPDDAIDAVREGMVETRKEA